MNQDGLIEEYNVQYGPYSATYVRTYTGGTYIDEFINYPGPSAITAIDDNNLIIAGESVYRYDITNDTTTKLFGMPNIGDNCYSDIIYNPVTQELAFQYFDSVRNNYFIRFTDMSGNLIAELNTYDYIPNAGQALGLFTYNQVLFMTYSDSFGGNKIYEVSLESLNIVERTDLEPLNSSEITVLEGATIQVENVDWAQPPVFEF